MDAVARAGRPAESDWYVETSGLPSVVVEDYFQGSALWPPGWTKLRVYFVPAGHEIKPLIDAYRPVLERFDFVAPVPDAWLHETLAVVEGRPTEAVTAAELAHLQARLRDRIGALPEFTLLARGATATQYRLWPA